MTKRITKPKAVNQNLAQQPTEVRIVMNEMGSSGLKETQGFVSEAYNRALYYPTVAPLYARLRSSMPTMVMVARAFSAWSKSVKPYVDLPENPTDDDKRYQEFIEQDFDNVEGGFGKYIETNVTRTLFDGFGVWEALPSRRERDWVPPAYQDINRKSWQDDWRSEYDDGLIGIRRLAWRDSSTFSGWEFDGRKKAIGYKQQDFPNPVVTLPLNQCLHHTFGDPNNPEGNAPLQAIWRLERIKYGLEVVMGIGFEHSAGHLKVQKTEKGTLSADDKTLVKNAARAIMSAQEGNYALFPFGIEGAVMDIGFQAAGNLLETIKFYDVLSLSIYMMQFIALNTMTNTGALASQVDSTQMGIFTFNAALDGLAAQYDDQIGKRLCSWNRDNFPNLTKRPKIKFSHVENNLAMGELGAFLRTIQGIVPIGEDDIKAFRKRSGWMPENSPKPGDEIKPAGAPAQPQGKNEPTPMPMDPQVSADASNTKDVINQSLRFVSRATRGRQ